MKLQNVRQFAPVMLTVFIVACSATTGVTPKGNDLYTINVYRGDADKVKLRAHQHAQRFCAKTEQTMQVVSEQIRTDPNSPRNTLKVIDLDFKCISP